MSDQIRTIRLGGEAGERFGKEWKLYVDSVGEAVRAIEANHPGFREYLRTAEERGIGFVITVADREVSEDELVLVSKGDILIMPALFGSSASQRIIAGVAIIALMWWNPMGWAAGSAMLTAGYGVGASMVIGGVVEMLTPIPKMQSADLSSNNKPSYVFSGPVQTSEQGLPVPIGAGTMLIGGTVISAGISAEDISTSGTNSDPILIDNNWG